VKYADVTAGQLFVEAADPKHPKRVRRIIKVRTTTKYAAEVEVVAGRGTGKVLYLQLKKICDAAQWELTS
jgi:hypothetical protein